MQPISRAIVCILMVGVPCAAAAIQKGTVTMGGTIKNVSQDRKSITIHVGMSKGSREEVFRVSNDTSITLNGATAKVRDLEPGTRITLTYEKRTKQALSIKATSAKADASKSPKAPAAAEKTRTEQTGSEKQAGAKAAPEKATTAKSAAAKPAGPEAPDKTVPAKPTTKPAEPAAPSAPPQPAGSKPVWTTDLARMKIPDAKVSGTIHGREFVLDSAKLENGILTLRQGKDFWPEAAITVFLFINEEATVAGKTFRVSGTSGFGSPHIHLSSQPKDGGLGQTKSDQFLDKYAMLLEFGQSQNGQVQGKIYACLPDEHKSVVAGTFTIEVFDSTHPLVTGSEISGKITYRGGDRKLHVHIGCLGKNQRGELEAPGVGFDVSLDEEPRSASNTTWAPRFSALAWDQKGGFTHKHMNRPAGHYLVYVRGTPEKVPLGEGAFELSYEGFYDWKWVELKDDKAKIAVDLTIDPNTLGALEVTVTGNVPNDSIVTYLPLDPNGALPLPDAHRYMSGTCRAKVAAGKAVIRNLREGKYQIALGNATATIEVKAGATTPVELAAP